MPEEIIKRITRAKELLEMARHAAMATVNEDGSPHNTPFRFLYDPKLEYVYWGSHPESLHSLNIIRTGQIFVVIYDITGKGGLYIKADEGHILEGAELEEGLKVHNSFRIKEGSTLLQLSYYQNENPQRMWRAKVTNIWVNGIKKDQNGLINKDRRYEITTKDLL